MCNFESKSALGSCTDLKRGVALNILTAVFMLLVDPQENSGHPASSLLSKIISGKESPHLAWF